MATIPLLRVSQQELQRKFNENEGGYPSRLSALRRVRAYDEPASPESRQDPGTRSIIDKFYDAEDLVVVIHYFLKLDNTLGGSGKLDPKKLRVGNVLYWTP